jgi:hypothetical protein
MRACLVLTLVVGVVPISVLAACGGTGTGGTGGTSSSSISSSGTGGTGGGLCGVAPTQFGAACILPTTLTSSMTLGSECQPWHIGASGTQVGDPSSPVLTIEPCVTIEVDPGGFLNVAGPVGPAGLVAVGTAKQPITFISSASTPAAGDWGPLAILDGAVYPTTTLQFVDIEYGGGNFGNVGLHGTLVVDNAQPQLILLHDLLLHENLVDGITLGGAAGTTGVGFAAGSGNLTIGNWGTGHSPIRLDIADAAATVPATLTTGVSGHDGQVEIDENAPGDQGVLVDVTQTWPSLPIPYLLDNPMLIVGVGTTAATLTIAAPNVIQSLAGGEIVVDPDGEDLGYLVANGTNGNIVFTTSSQSPSAGDWEGISFNVGPGGQGPSSLTGCTIEYAGAVGLGTGVCTGGGSCTEAPVIIQGDCGPTFVVGPTISGCTINNYPATDSGIILEGSPTNAASYSNNTFGGGVSNLCNN